MSPRFLLVRFSAIGDCVMSAWTATSIRHKYPEAFLCWAAESRCAPVIDRQTLCSRLLEVPRDRWKKHRWSPATWREQLVFYTSLRKLKFDYGIDLQGHSKTALCLRLASPTKRVQARATDSLSSRLNPMVGAPAEGTHTVEWNHQVLSTFGDFELSCKPIMPSTAVEHEPRLVTISVSAGQPDKAYSAERWLEVAASLKNMGYDVTFLGGPTDGPIQLAGTRDLVGKVPLLETMGWVAASRLHLCADTGTGHMAAAYGVPVVSVFGPTDGRTFRPYTDNGIVLKNGQSTDGVSVSQLIEAAKSLLES